MYKIWQKNINFIAKKIRKSKKDEKKPNIYEA